MLIIQYMRLLDLYNINKLFGGSFCICYIFVLYLFYFLFGGKPVFLGKKLLVPSFVNGWDFYIAKYMIGKMRES